MPKVQVKSIEGNVVGEMELPASIFEVPFNPYPVQEVVRMQMANKRRGTHKTKERSEIRGSTKKRYRQKGTGHARAGSVKSPLRRGGGIIFGPRPRDYSFYPPKKVRKAAIRIALSQKLRDGNLEIYREFEIETPKTKVVLSGFEKESQARKTLIITGEVYENMYKSLRNVETYKVLKTEGLNVYDLLNHQRCILMETSVTKIIERLDQ